MWALIQNRRIKKLVTLEVEQEQTSALRISTDDFRHETPGEKMIRILVNGEC
jgi:hypothetical protein